MSPECISSSSSARMLREDIIAMATVILSAILMWLVTFATPKELRDYARVLLATCVVELLFATSAYFVQMVRSASTCKGLQVEARTGLRSRVGNPWSRPCRGNAVEP